MFLCSSAAWLSGCGTHTHPQALPRPATAPDRSFQAHWDASTHVLTAYGFEIDYRDRRSGVIATRPMVGQHLTEFWRRDAATASALLEGSLQKVYRTANVRVRQADDDPDRFDVAVEVRLARSDRPTPQITSTSEAFAMFRASSSALREMELRTPAGASGRPGVTGLGEDDALADELADAIRRRAASHAGPVVDPGPGATPQTP
jgi:hypothetical protein